MEVNLKHILDEDNKVAWALKNACKKRKVVNEGKIEMSNGFDVPNEYHGSEIWENKRGCE